MAVKQGFCLNCESALKPEEKFCPACGQSTKNMPIGIKDISTQIIFTIFNLDNTLFRTISLLPKPWKLTENYIAGKRIPYYHPGRMFIILLFLLFSLLTIFNFEYIDFELGTDIIITEEDYKIKDRINFLADSLQLDSTSRKYLNKTLFNDKVIPHDTMVFEPFIVFNNDVKEKQISLRDAVTLPLDSVFLKYNIHGFWEKSYFAQFIKLYKNNQDFIKYFLQKLLWTVPLGILLLSLFMKLLYLRRGYYLIEHLVFLLHLHASLFSFFIILVLLESGFEIEFPEWTLWLQGGLPLMLGLLALYKYYGQSMLKTLLKYMLMLMIYSFNLLIGLIFILVFSIFTY